MGTLVAPLDHRGVDIPYLRRDVGQLVGIL